MEEAKTKISATPYKWDLEKLRKIAQEIQNFERLEERDREEEKCRSNS